MIRYYSTNGDAPVVDFETALFRGLAPDGGLYFPETFPRFSAEEIDALRGASLTDVAYQVLNKWLGDIIDADALRAIADEANYYAIPMHKVGDTHVLELFHGPTLAFKDVAAQNLSRIMSYFLQQRNETVKLLVATSGDTGGAIAHGFANVPNVEVYVLFPKGRVSALQEQQLTRVADNVHPIEVDGVFDDCQAMVKRAFNDPELADLKLTSANSISIGRLLPQIIYYVYAYAVLGRDDICFVVPSGNFGNLTGGLFARAMGLPFNAFVAATNANDSAVRYVETARYAPRETIRTLSNAMDVGNPSNFVRVLELFEQDYEAFREVMYAARASDADAVAAMQAVYDKYGYLLDPHTAVGWHVLEELGIGNGELGMVNDSGPTVLVATAAPVKFAKEIEGASGIVVDDSAEIAKLEARPQRKVSIDNDYAALVTLLS